jgi:hypothetical protein
MRYQPQRRSVDLLARTDDVHMRDYVQVDSAGCHLRNQLHIAVGSRVRERDTFQVSHSGAN